MKGRWMITKWVWDELTELGQYRTYQSMLLVCFLLSTSISQYYNINFLFVLCIVCNINININILLHKQNEMMN